MHQGNTHLPGGIDCCANGADAPFYFSNIQRFDPGNPGAVGHLIICTGVTDNSGSITIAIWLFKVLPGVDYEAVERTATTSSIANAPPDTEFPSGGPLPNTVEPD